MLYSYFHSRSIKLQLIKGKWHGKAGYMTYDIVFAELANGKRGATVKIISGDPTEASDPKNGNILLDESYSAHTILGTDDVTVRWVHKTDKESLLPNDLLCTVTTSGIMTLKTPNKQAFLTLIKQN